MSAFIEGWCLVFSFQSLQNVCFLEKRSNKYLNSASSTSANREKEREKSSRSWICLVIPSIYIYSFSCAVRLVSHSLLFFPLTRALFHSLSQKNFFLFFAVLVRAEKRSEAIILFLSSRDTKTISGRELTEFKECWGLLWKSACDSTCSHNYVQRIERSSIIFDVTKGRKKLAKNNETKTIAYSNDL